MKFLLSIFLFCATACPPLMSTETCPCEHDPVRDYDPCEHEHEDPKGPDPVDYSSYIDLEKLAQPFVLESKEIKFEAYPTAFNPTIARWKGSLLLSFRIRHPVTGSTDQIGMVWLNEDFVPQGEPVVLEVPPYPSTLPSKQQDPRLIPVGEDLYMVYNNVIKGEIRKEVRRILIAKVHFDNGKFYTDPPEMILSFEGEKEQRCEKNWTPFVYDGELYLIYSLTPHRILRYLPGTGSCETFSTTSSQISWPWGALRGGTQAYLIDGKYMSFFHSSIDMATVHSKGKNIQHYLIGAYTFSSEPPFEITSVSPEPIVGKGFYSGPEYKTWKPLRVVFADGYVYDDKYIWVVYGKQDFEMWIAKIDKKLLFDSLIPVSLKPE